MKIDNLNTELLIRQGVSEESQEEMLEIYDNLDYILKNPQCCVNPVDVIEKLEFRLQELWKFPQDRNYHRYWKFIKDCCCPIDDNKYSYGTPYRYVSAECPWHSKKEIIK